MQIIPEYIVYVVCLNLCGWPIILSSPFILFHAFSSRGQGLCSAHLPPGSTWNHPAWEPGSHKDCVTFQRGDLPPLLGFLVFQSICLFGPLVLLAPLEWPWRTELLPKIKKIRPTVLPMWRERIWNHLYHFCMLTKTPVQLGTLQALCIFYK